MIEKKFDGKRVFMILNAFVDNALKQNRMELTTENRLKFFIGYKRGILENDDPMFMYHPFSEDTLRNLFAIQTEIDTLMVKLMEEKS